MHTLLMSGTFPSRKVTRCHLLPPIAAVTSSLAPPLTLTSPTIYSPEKIEVFTSLENWATQNLLPILKPVHLSWQPQDFLPNSSQSYDQFQVELRALRDQTIGLSDDYFVVLVGDMITEEALPTYQTLVNRPNAVKDQTGFSENPWAVWSRAWTAEENRHGDLLRMFLYLSGRVDMTMVDKTIQYLIGSGMNSGIGTNPYLLYVYTSFQERATFISHCNTARLAKTGGDSLLARICGSIAADEKRHEGAYTQIVGKLLEVDPNGMMLAIGEMMRKRITMPAHLMYDGNDPKLFEHFGAVTQRLGVYTTSDYADVLEHFIRRWRLETLQGLTADGREAQDFVCGLAPKIRRLIERGDERAKALEPQSVKFSWIFNKEILL